MTLAAGIRSGIRGTTRSGINPGAGGGAVPSNARSLAFNRSLTQYATIADATQTGLDFAGTATATFAAWCYVETLPATAEYYTAFGKFRSVTGGYAGPQIQENGGGYLFYGVCVGPGNGSYYVPITALLAAQTWIHLAFTFNGALAAAARFQFFADAVSLGSGTVSSDGATQINGNADEFRVGDLNSPYSGRYWNGKLDDVVICDQVLTAAEIATLRADGPSAATPGIRDAWKWDGETLASIINANTLTPSANAPTYAEETPY